MATHLASSRSAYQKSAILTASREQLVVMLYDGMHRFLCQASGAMRERDIETAHLRLRRAEAIINHLLSTLDFTVCDELPFRLESIYHFCLRQLNEARIKQDADKVDEVDRLLGGLRDAWARVVNA
jgi:flagellar secretion chaperone FliS